MSNTVECHEYVLVHVLRFLGIPKTAPQESHDHGPDIVQESAICVSIAALDGGHPPCTAYAPFAVVSQVLHSDRPYVRYRLESRGAPGVLLEAPDRTRLDLSTTELAPSPPFDRARLRSGSTAGALVVTVSARDRASAVPMISCSGESFKSSPHLVNGAVVSSRKDVVRLLGGDRRSAATPGWQSH